MLLKKILVQKKEGLVPVPSFLYVWGTNSDSTTLFTNTSNSIVETTSPVLVFDDKNYLILPESNVDDVEGFASVITANNELLVWGQDKNLNLGSFRSLVKDFNKIFSQSRSTSFAIKTDGTLWSWGYNFRGELGQNDRIHRSSPVQIGTSSWNQIRTAAETNFAIRSDNTLWFWGFELPTGNLSVYRSSPIQVGTDSDWVQVSVGWSHGAAIKSDGSLWTFGYNNNGQLGLNTTFTFRTTDGLPDKVGTDSWIQVSCGINSTYAIRSDYTLWVWGRSFGGELGDGSRTNRSSPVQIAGSWTQVEGGYSFAGAVRSDGELFAWGVNNLGRFGTSSTSRSSPVQVGVDMGASGYIVPFAIDGLAFNFGFLIIKSDGKLYASGLIAGKLYENFEQVTDFDVGTTRDRVFASMSLMAFLGSTDSVFYRVGRDFSGASLLLEPDDLVSQLYDDFETPSDYFTPAKVDGSWSQISVGKDHTLAIKTDGTLWGWGKNTYGQLGLGNFNDVFSPVQITTGSWNQVRASDYYSLAIRDDKLLFGAGLNESSVLTDSLSSDKSWVAISVGGVTELSTFNDGPFFMAIKSDGTLWGWGDNNDGQLGINQDSNFIGSPVQIGKDKWSGVKCGDFNFTLALKEGTPDSINSDRSYEIWGWGLNFYGELGQNNRTARSSPVLVQSRTDKVVSFSVGARHAAAIWEGTTTQYLFTWGNNTNGELGLGDRIHRSSPVQVSSWVKSGEANVFCGSENTFFIFSTSLYAMGDNFWGDLGVGDRLSRSSPTLVGSNFLKVSPDYSTLAIKTDSTLWAWGNNTWGQLGQDDRFHRSSPVQIGTSSWTQIQSGGNDSMAIKSDGTLWHWGAIKISADIFDFRSSPIQVGTSSWSQIASSRMGGNIGKAGEFSGKLLIDNSGDLYYFGEENYQPEDLVWISYSDPVQIPASGYVSTLTQISSDSWNQVTSTNKKVLAIKSNRTLWGWGDNRGLVIKPAESVHKLSFTQLSSGRLNNLASEGFFGIADGKLYYNHGNLPPGDFLGDVDSDNDVVSEKLREYDGSQFFSGDIIYTDGISGSDVAKKRFVITSLYEMWACGYNVDGTLGQNNKISVSNSWVQIPGSWIQVSIAGDEDFSSVFAIKTDGTLWSWGYNNFAQLGQNNLIHRSSPVQVGTSSWTQVLCCGDNAQTYALAIRSDATLWAWGFPSSGQLGQNNTILYSSPVQVGLDSDWDQIAGSSRYSFAIKTDKTLWAWGSGTNGLLGLNDTINRSSPVQIPGSWNQIVSGSFHTLAIKSDGTLWGWGWQARILDAENLGIINGYLNPDGINSFQYVSSPVQIGSKSNVVLIGLNFNASFFVDDEKNFYFLSSFSVDNIFDYRNFYEYFTQRYDNYYVTENPNLKVLSSPVQIDTKTWKKITVENNFAIGIDSSSKLYGWGINSKGNLGLSNYELKTEPSVIGTSRWNDVEIGPDYALAIDSKKNLYGWGENKYFTIASDIQKEPTPTWSSVKVGVSFMLAIKSDGTLWSWGNNFRGELGQNDRIHRSSPVQIGSDTWSKIDVAALNVCGIKSDGTLWSWGNNTNGQLGQDDRIHRSSPVQIPGSWSQVSCGLSFAAGIKSDASLWSWGNNSNGQLGLNDTIHRSSPVQVGTSSWTQISCGAGHMAGQTTANNFYIWGRNSEGQLGQNDFVHRSSPTLVSTFNINYDIESTNIPKKLYATNSAVLGGSISVLISNTYNQLVMIGGRFDDVSVEDYLYFQNPLELRRSSPVILRQPMRIRDYATSVWAGVSFYIDETGKLWVIGSNFTNGLNKSSGITNSWTQLGTFTYNRVDAGFSHVAAISTGGVLYTWGYNFNGQLGDDTRIHRSSPVSLGAGYADVKVGKSHTLAIKTDKTLWAWGRNSSGELGLGDILNRSSPVQIPGSWLQVSAGTDRSFGIKTDGTLWVWGNNFVGQLGQSDRIHRSSPVQIAGSWSQVGDSIAIKTDGTLWSWGSNLYGQLGLGDILNRSSPVQIPGSWLLISEYVDIARLAVKDDYTLWAWGYNTEGNLGQNDTVHRSSPVQISVNFGTSWSYIKATGLITHFKSDLEYSYFSGRVTQIPTAAFPTGSNYLNSEYPMLYVHGTDNNFWPNTAFAGVSTFDSPRSIITTNNNNLYVYGTGFSGSNGYNNYGTLFASNVNVTEVTIYSVFASFLDSTTNYLYYFGRGVDNLDEYWRVSDVYTNVTLLDGLRSINSIYYNSPVLIGSNTDQWIDVSTLDRSSFALKE